MDKAWRELAVGPWRRDTGYTAEETAGVEASLRQQGVPETGGQALLGFGARCGATVTEDVYRV